MAGRPREFDKDQALKRAMLLFWQNGYEGTSMSALVEALGIASARIYAAFGSKEQLFREAVALYEAGEGGFAERAMQELAVKPAIERLLHDAVTTYTRRGRPSGCLVVSAAASTAPEHIAVQDWLAQHRLQRTQSIIERIRLASDRGELLEGADVQALGDFYATVLHGISVQARDGVGRARLLEAVNVAVAALPLQAKR